MKTNNRRIIVKIRTGSHLYGLNNENSDEDFVSVFMPTAEDLLGFHKVDMINESTKASNVDRRNTKDDIDDVSYSLPKFLHLLVDNNPNIVELLFATPKNILIKDPLWDEIVSHTDKTISQKCYHKFSGYAFSQRKKLVVKKERYESLGKAIEYLEGLCLELGHKEWLTNSKAKIFEGIDTVLNNTLKYYKGSKENCESFHVGMSIAMVYEKIVAERNRYGWRVKTDSFETLGFDSKFAYNLIRLQVECLDLLEEGKINFPISGTEHDIIMQVRNGEVDYDMLMSLYDELKEQCDKAYEQTNIPKSPNMKFWNKWLIDILTKEIKGE